MGITNTIAKLQAYFEAWHTTGKNLHLDLVYPVGSIYMSVNDVNPKNLFGGEWEKIEGRFLLGSGDGYPLITAGENTKGGNKDAIVVSHSHTASHTHTQPKHTHTSATHSHKAESDSFSDFLTSEGDIAVSSNYGYLLKNKSSSTWSNYIYPVYDKTKNFSAHIYQKTQSAAASVTINEAATTINTAQVTTSNSGESGANKNMPPYIVVNIWQRTK